MSWSFEDYDKEGTDISDRVKFTFMSSSPALKFIIKNSYNENYYLAK